MPERYYYGRRASSSRRERPNESASSDRKAKHYVKDKISRSPVVIFSKTTCPSCVQCKRTFKDIAAHVSSFYGPSVAELDQMGHRGKEIQEYLARLTGKRTVPSVFIGGRFVGGNDEVQRMKRDGSLKQRIRDAVRR